MEIVSVTELTTYLKLLLESNLALQDVWVQGEVSNFMRSGSGHCYFDLSDGAAVLHCVMFRSNANRAWRYMSNGALLVVHGSLTIYPQRGQYQVLVDLVQPQGVGMMSLLFEQLRLKLEQEGLFDDERKRSLPAFPRRIGIVTSETGAVLRDIKTVIERRYPLVELVLAPAQVQGDAAVASVVQALAALNLLHQQLPLDAIIVARGGGSAEDLSAFNAEAIARAVYASRVPVISAIGHETDTTLIDLVADVRAPTPSAAAELAVPDIRDLRARLNDAGQRLVTGIRDELDGKREDVAAQVSALNRLSPLNAIRQYRQRIDDLLTTGERTLRYRAEIERERVTSRIGQLHTLNPRRVLARGYSIVRLAGEGPIVTAAAQVSTGDALEIQTARGRYDVVVMDSEEEYDSNDGTSRARF